MGLSGRAADWMQHQRSAPLLLEIHAQVLKGYTGDEEANAEWTGQFLDLVDKSAFDVMGTRGARPFEVATVRLSNMIKIIPNWEVLAPTNKVGRCSCKSG